MDLLATFGAGPFAFGLLIATILILWGARTLALWITLKLHPVKVVETSADMAAGRERDGRWLPDTDTQQFTSPRTGREGL